MIKLHSVVVLLLLATSVVKPQETPRTSSAKTNPNSQSSSVVRDKSKESHDKEAILQVRGFAARALGFDTSAIKVPALARLAELLWMHDQPYAEELFMKAFDSTALAKSASPAEQARLAALRRLVIARIARCSPLLAKRLITDGDAEVKTNMSVAYDVLDVDPKQASEFARSTFKSGVDPSVYSFLLNLRAKDKQSADALFMDALARLDASVAVDGNVVLFLGTYVFTSARILVTAPDAVAQIGVAGVGVPDITVERPDVSPTLIRAYLATALNVVSRSTSDAQQLKLNYIISYLLAPKAAKFAPDLLPGFTNANQVLTRSVPKELTQESTFANFKKGTFSDPKELDNVLEDIEQTQDQQRRDIRYLSLVGLLWLRGDFTRAREIAGKISVLDTREALQVVITFGEAARLLEAKEKELNKVEKLADKLPLGIERALLYIGIARARTNAGDVPSARIALEAAVASVRNVEDATRPIVIMNVAAQMASIAPEHAVSSMIAAFNAFNKLSTSAAVPKWKRRIEVSPSSLDFPLKIKGFEYDLDQALIPLMKADPDATVAAINGLTNERYLALALVGAAKVLLPGSK